MDSTTLPNITGNDGSSQSPKQTKSSRLSRNDRRWEAHKDEIRRIYLEENNTLQVTMERIEEAYGFKACTRKWKDKIKEWKFDKYLTTESKKAIVAKAEKRQRELGKETVFYHGGVRITEERMESFKRMIMNGGNRASPCPATPLNITYHSPAPEGMNSLTMIVDELDEEHTSPSDNPTKLGTASNPIHVLGTDASQNAGLVAQLDDLGIEQIDAVEMTDHAPHPEVVPALGVLHVEDVIRPLQNAPPDSSPLSNDVVYFGPGAFATAATAKQLYELGLKCKEIERWDSAESHLLQSIDQYKQLEGKDSFNALQVLSVLADVYQLQGMLPKAVSMYREVVEGREKILGGSCLGSVLSIFMLAQLLQGNEEYHEALKMGQKALAGFEVLKMEDQVLECQCMLVDLFRKIRARVEAEALLETILAKSLELGLKELLVATVEALRELQLDLLSVNHWLLIPELSRMLNLLGNENLDTGKPTKFSPGVLFQGVRIASAYSSMDKFEYAQRLFSSTIPHLGSLDNSKYGKQKAEAELQFAIHYQQQQLWVSCAAHLILAIQNFSPDIGKAAASGYLKNAFDELSQDLWKHEGSALPDLFENHIEKLRWILGRVDSPDMDAPRRAASELTSWDSMSISTRSHKYGVTYSVSEITGVSDSVFMVA